MIGAAMTGGDVLIEDAIWGTHNRPLLYLRCRRWGNGNRRRKWNSIQSDISKLRPVTVKTLPYPGFPTDMQAQFTALMAMAKGESTMIETVFENRFQHLEEMRRMGVHSDIMGIQLVSLEGKLPRCRGYVDRFTSKCNLGLDGLW